MNELYSDLAEVYEAMYTTFIDYELEYNFYSKILKKWDKQSVLEIGSGTGNLTQYFEKNGFEYYGLDLSEEMLAIARKKNPNSILIEGDMRCFQLKNKIQSTLITGRTISYLRTNADVNATFRSIYNNLEKGGLLCFDFIDANRFIPEIGKGKEVSHEATYKGINYLRKSTWNVELSEGMHCTWESKYYKKAKNELLKIGKDSAIVRTFTKDEIAILLSFNNFNTIEIIEKKSYAFPTYAVIAQKE